MTSKQTVGSGELIRIDGVITRLDVDDHELAFVLRTEAGYDVVLKNLITPPGEFFLAVPRARGSAHDYESTLAS
jgi:hypothetical protein